MENETMESNYPRGGQPTEADLKGWNWGAFALNWIWALNHKYYLGLLCFVPCVGWIMAIYMGLNGNKIAWESGRFSSVDDMQACQAVWKKWGIGILILSVILIILNFVITAAAVGAAAASGAASGR
ncbi:MAG: ribonuclease G [Fimbriimonadaceae bacterium]